jgi:ribosomal protein S27AE
MLLGKGAKLKEVRQMSTKTKPKAQRPKTMGELFKACPCCGSANLAAFADEMFCRRCDWNSLQAHAEYMVRFEEAEERRQCEEARRSREADAVAPQNTRAA